MDYDLAYRNRVGLAVYKAIIEASKEDGADAAVIKSGAVFDALLMIAAYVIAGSPLLQTPQAVRLFAEGATRKLRQQI